MFLTALLASHLFLAPACVSLQEVDKVIESSEGIQRIVLVRHGECLFNVPDQNGISYVSGNSPSIPLTPKGQAQARELAFRLIEKMDPEEDLIVCSSSALRAHVTAVCLVEELSKHFKCRLGRCYEGLCELGHGNWEGKPKDEKYFQELHKWDRLSAKEKLTTPKMKRGESYKAVIDRALPALQHIVDTHRGKTIFVVTHFMTLNALSLYWSQAAPELSTVPGSKLPQIIFDNCDMLIIEIPEGGSVKEGQPLMHVKTEIQ